MTNSTDSISSPGRLSGWRLGGALCFCLGLLALDLAVRQPLPSPAQAVWPAAGPLAAGTDLRPLAQGRIPSPPTAAAVHASTLLAMPATHASAVLAFWFAGSRESGPDVQIAASAFDRRSQQWLAARFVVNRQEAGRALGFGLRRLGNPVAWLDGHGRIHLFVVATGPGGWAAARILHLRQVGDSQDFAQLAFEPLGVLPLSWLWNISHLVRANPLPLADGGMVLPAYFELGRKYPVALRFDADGGFRGMERISSRTDLLQPTLLMQSPTRWLALMRDSGPARNIRVAGTSNGGRDWQDLPDLSLRNPDASVAGLGLAPDQLLLAHNARPDSRSVLDLSLSADGVQWTPLAHLAQGAGASEYSYPSMTWADGSLWVSYTDERKAIAWQRFTFLPAVR